jgi:hypothetical protein
MTTPVAFISFDFKLNADDRARFVAESGSSAQPFAVEDWSAERKSPRSDWDKMVHAKIGRCDFMIVLVSNEMDTAPVAEEILEAKRCNVPFFGVYVGDAKPGTALPEGLGANRTIPWDWTRIAGAIGQVSKEGKHHLFA